MAVSPSISLLSAGSHFGSAVFYVTNRSPFAIQLACVEVQFRTNGGWGTLSEKESRLIDGRHQFLQTLGQPDDSRPMPGRYWQPAGPLNLKPLKGLAFCSPCAKAYGWP